MYLVNYNIIRENIQFIHLSECRLSNTGLNLIMLAINEKNLWKSIQMLRVHLHSTTNAVGPDALRDHDHIHCNRQPSYCCKRMSLSSILCWNKTCNSGICPSAGATHEHRWHMDFPIERKKITYFFFHFENLIHKYIRDLYVFILDSNRQQNESH